MNSERREQQESTRDHKQKKTGMKKSGGYGRVEDRSTWVKFTPTCKYLQWAKFSFNPVVTSVSLTIIIAFSIWAILSPEEAQAEFAAWKFWVGNNFSWLYIGATNCWIIFIVVVYNSKYGDTKLGPDNSTPEYNNATWFCMLFGCGMGTGLFFYGVSEPVYHYIGPNRYTRDPTMPDNRLAQEAINLTLLHYGLHSWVVFTVVGLTLAFMAHREGLPLTMKSCFYPLIGEKIFGWPGDMVDILSVIATLFGVCTSLGLGTMQINEGLHLMKRDIPVGTHSQLIIIWTVTLVATISCATGVKNGVRRVSEVCFSLGLVLMLCALFLDNTVFTLNLYVQSMGYYAHRILQLGFHTDAFAQLGPSAGAEHRGRYVPAGFGTTDGPAEWINDWTIFYWGWWISWCPFVGMFIAKISAGRTVKEFIAGTMVAPTVYVFMWMIIFGGLGIRMEREAAQNNLCCHNINMGTVLNLSVSSPDKMVSIADDLCNPCNSCATLLLGKQIEQGTTYQQMKEQIELYSEPSFWGVTTVNRTLTRLSCRRTEEMWFDMMISYGSLGNFLCGFSFISLIMYFVTSADSGSLVIDCLASNGQPEPPPLQRIIWAFLEGLTATALLVAGGRKALEGLQAMAIATGMIYCVIVCIVCWSLWRALQVEDGDRDPRGAAFEIQILDPFFTDPLNEVLSSGLSTSKLLFYSIFNIVIAPLTVAKTASRVTSPSSFWPVCTGLTFFLFMFVGLHVLQIAVDGSWALAWISYIIFGSGVAMVRGSARAHLNIEGHPLEDLFVSLFLYPCAALQMEISTRKNKKNMGGSSKAREENTNMGFNNSTETKEQCE